MNQISGTTRVAALIGFPATYSLSPILHASAYGSLGLDATYVVFPVLPETLPAAIAGVKALGFLGLSVTVPHKQTVLPLLADVDPVATRLQAVNTIVPTPFGLKGYNTDGAGFLAGLRADVGLDVAGLRIAIIGAGGAARAVCDAVGRAGAREVVIINRSAAKAESCAALAGPVGRVGSQADLGVMDLVVNATPIGMDSHPGCPIEPTALNSASVVVDLIYQPAETELLRSASEAGCRTANGLSMLIHQAGAQVALFTGQEPDISIMQEALRSHYV